MGEIEALEDEIRNGPVWTVVGFWHESWERWMGYYYAATARQAEDMAQLDAKERGLHLAVVAVFEGKQKSADAYATWVDPEVDGQEDMDSVLRRMGYVR